MKILTDLHHSDLYFSNHLLLEKRLGFELFRPIGKEWAEEGLWKIHTFCEIGVDPTVIDQYLIRGSGENYEREGANYSDGVWFQKRACHNYTQKAVTLQKFKDMRFDIIMPSHNSHYDSWKSLRDRFQPHAKIVNHVGNVNISTDLDYVIRSVPFHGKSKKCVLAHQELDSSIYECTDIVAETRNITSVTNGYTFPRIYEDYKMKLPNYNFKYFGAGSPDGPLHGTKSVAEQMKKANLGWSTKDFGGLGHSNMGWMYSGRPVITNMSQHIFTGECAIKLFEPGVTCIDVDSGSVEEVSKEIVKWMDPETGQKHGDMAKKRFHEIVNYESEAENVKQFLAEIL